MKHSATGTLPFPLVRGGGGLLFFIGLGIASGAAVGVERLVIPLGIGALLGFACQPFIKLYGRPPFSHLIAFAIAILVEIALASLVVHLFYEGDARTFWLWVLATVGVHFLFMKRSHGPLLEVLGGLCLFNALVGLVFPGVPFWLVWLIDGSFKVLFGLRMLLIAPQKPLSADQSGLTGA